MKEFIYISYNERAEPKVKLDKLYKHLEKRGYTTYINQSTKGPFEKSIRIQCTLNADESFNAAKSVLFNGETRGIYSQHATADLAHSEVVSLLESSDLLDQDLEFEGTLSYVKEYNNQVVFQNDIEGFRKLFYYSVDGLFCMSSFMPLILLALNEKWKLRADAFARFFVSREATWPSTMVEGIFALEPKTKAKFSQSGIEKKHFTYSAHVNPQKIALDELKSNLLDNYFQQLRDLESKKSVAVTLSGGYDSSSMLKCALDAMRQKPHAISVGYKTDRFKDSNVYDETVFAEKIAKYYNVPFIKHVVERDEFLESFENTLNVIDQPAFDPSSFCLMASLAKKDGFNALVSGMGGDALYKTKLTMRLYFRYFHLFSKMPQGLMNNVVSLTKQRGPFAFLQHLYDEKGRKYDNPFLVLDRGKISPFGKKLFKTSVDDLFAEGRMQQQDYWSNVVSQSKTIFDIIYSSIAFSNPDEYHAYLSALRQNVVMKQPLVTLDSVQMVMNASAYHPEINSRKFLVDLFGTNTEILYQGKSGFSIPYYDWAKGFSDEVFNFWAEADAVKENIDLGKFKNIYLKDKENNSLNVFVWRLYVVMRYVQKYGIAVC